MQVLCALQPEYLPLAVDEPVVLHDLAVDGDVSDVARQASLRGRAATLFGVQLKI